jgi:hypothetical protein
MSAPAAIAIGAHPDDIEFTMAGTLALLKKAGFRIHCLNIASGSCGSLEYGRGVAERAKRPHAYSVPIFIRAAPMTSRFFIRYHCCGGSPESFGKCGLPWCSRIHRGIIWKTI